MKTTTEISRALREACALLSHDRQALLTRLGMIGISDHAFTVALVLVQRLEFETDREIELGWICERSGLMPYEVEDAEIELVEAGAVTLHRVTTGSRRVSHYRLAMP